MQFAYDQQHQLIYLTDAAQAAEFKANGAAFYCPECGAQLNILLPANKKPYFAHPRASRPQTHGETTLHQLGKYRLSLGLTQLQIPHQLERPSDNKQRRADVAVWVGKTPIALEWQCAKISVGQITGRSASYHSQGIQVIWLLGPAHRFDGRLRKTQQAYLNYAPALGFYLAYLKPATGQFIFWHHIRQWELTRKVSFQTLTCDLKTGLSYCLLAKTPTLRQQKTADFRQPAVKQALLKTRLLHRDKQFLQLQGFCYEAGHDLQQLPDVCFAKRSLPPIFLQDSCLVNCQLLLCLEKRKRWTYQDIYAAFKALMCAKLALCCQSDAWLRYVLNQFLQRLIHIGFLSQHSALFEIHPQNLGPW